MAANLWEWGWDAVAAIATTGATLAALWLANREGRARRAALKEQRQVLGSAYLLTIKWARTHADTVLLLVRTGAEIDPDPRDLDRIGAAAGRAQAILGRGDAIQLMPALPSVARHLAAAAEASRMVNEGAQALIRLYRAPEHHAERRDLLTTMCGFGEAAVRHYAEAVRICAEFGPPVPAAVTAGAD